VEMGGEIRRDRGGGYLGQPGGGRVNRAQSLEREDDRKEVSEIRVVFERPGKDHDPSGWIGEVKSSQKKTILSKG